MFPESLPLTIARGGTSRACFLPMSALPATQAERDELCLRLIGSPDPQAVDGLGGGVSSNSKVMFVGTSQRADLETLFAQVSPTERSVDWSGNCGNISSAVLHYARHTGLISATRATVWNLNSQAKFELVLDDDRVDMRFLNPGGEKCGSIFPAGRRCQVDGVEVSLIDVANPIVITRAADVGVDPALGMAALNADAALLERLERLRVAAAQAMGLEPSKAIPRVAMVAPGTDLRVVMTSVGRIHHALPGTGILALAAAVALGDTVIEDVLPGPREALTLQHFKGDVEVSARAEGEELEWVALPRTARILMSGQAYL
ncbi:MAG: PrpF domain-containing protein [Corynebacterium sp.]|uniref:PrpF domain-containing protein n=1 Tax=Corynebacterium sp. TaxID=1720 RepID=UPI0026E037E7|nr:PrpF domain-containing protein [Corynebacterium sp.]MDO5670033.1 PrpF domain-containing protein [Corynebacterium sp.]